MLQHWNEELGSTPELRSLAASEGQPLVTPAAPWFNIESIEHGCDHTGAAQHPVSVLRRRSGT